MNTRQKVSVLGLSILGLAFVPGTAQTGMPDGRPPVQFCYVKRLPQEAQFRKAAEEAWRATRNGDAPFEAGFSIGMDGHPGRVQLSVFEPAKAATHLRLVSDVAALGTLHVHNRFGESTPSPEDVEQAKVFGKVLYVESRTGLYAINPDGKVRHMFQDMDWFSKKTPVLLCDVKTPQNSGEKPVQGR
jgi:hypothetical protein